MWVWDNNYQIPELYYWSRQGNLYKLWKNQNNLRIKGTHLSQKNKEFFWYQQFIQTFFKIISSLTQLTENILWKWKKTEQEIFKRLKKLFIIELILTQFDYNKKTMIEYNFSGYIIRNMFLQYNK